ncbi:J domain-containing protein [Angelakisella massiliensis]|uniref:J domain-containing protein n=1 Tax=Angelakisella massiliensis TaxID=1871018 RepID=UPI0024B1AC54|nr:J domain-containing protein [Angelakisella massiliensis]
MTDPYKVLGISPSATDEQVKDAYRQLARKYHPDNYVNNPLADLATEKMKEINEAYDEIQRQRRSGRGQTAAGASAGAYGSSYGSYNSYNGYAGQGGQSASQFSDIRVMINSGRLVEAEELLDGVPEYRRDAEWFFLKGSVAASKGWMDAALQYFSTACQKNPSNQEYRAVLNRLMYQRQTAYNQSVQMTSMSCCDLCAGMYCASCCCDCLGHGC